MEMYAWFLINTINARKRCIFQDLPSTNEQIVNIQKFLYILLNIHGRYAILNTANRRRSILVRSAAFEEGPKNPLKGITVKPLVPASYAQFGVGAEREVRTPALADVGRSTMA